MTKKARHDIYEEVTNQILELLEQGTVPWRNPIAKAGGGGWPLNLHSGKPYRGVNVFLLSAMSWARGFSSDYWLTFKQARDRGGQVRKGEKSSLVVFWKQYSTEDRVTGDEVMIPFLKHYNVFNAEQCEGIAPPDAFVADPDAAPFEPLVAAEAIMRGYKQCPTITHGGGRAYYRPSVDGIFMPQPERFDSRKPTTRRYFTSVHSTGHSKRLDRGLDTEIAPFGSPDYSKEELIAEMGAAFLSASAGILPPTIEQSAAYINGWEQQLKGDKKLVIQAASAAQKAADLILGTEFNDASTVEESAPSSEPTKPAVTRIDQQVVATSAATKLSTEKLGR
ncbi:MAG: ArdC-like ssDNA-binding domain-containing protein [Pirellulaceae bacterium]